MEVNGENSAGQEAGTSTSGTSKNENSCYVCLEKFQSKSHLNWHEINVHENPKNFKCPDCDETAFDSKSAFLKHRKSHVKKEPSICQLCGKKFRWPSALGYHMKRHTDKVTRECELLLLENCVENSVDNQGTSNSNENVNSCDISLEKFESKSQLMEHEIKAHENSHVKDVLTCQTSDQIIEKPSTLQEHVHTAHDKPQTSSECQLVKVEDSVDNQEGSTTEAGISCYVCLEKFESKSHLALHEINFHENPKSFKCLHCKEILKSKGAFLNHRKTHVRDRLSCQTCSITYFDKHYKLQKHIKRTGTHDGQGPRNGSGENWSHNQGTITSSSKSFSCYVCHQKFESKPRVKKHIVKVHRKAQSYKCMDCEEILVDRKSFLAHRQTHIFCQICAKEFKKPSALRIHARSHVQQIPRRKCQMLLEIGGNSANNQGTTTSNESSCFVCLEKFESKSHLALHEMEVHENPKNYKCAHCEETATSKRALLNHLKNHKEPLDCKTCCGQTFQEPSEFRQHIRNHTKPYECEFCQKHFSRSEYLETHKKIHGKRMRIFKCEECRKTFFTARDLARHVRNHTKPFPCRSCPKRFPSKWFLLQHARIHTGLKPFECSDCSKSFTTLNSVKYHTLTVHHGLKPFKCRFCKKRFRDTRKLRSHRRNEHDSSDDRDLRTEESEGQSQDEENNVKDEPIKKDEVTGNESTIPIVQLD